MKNISSGIEILTLMRDRISRQECPVCGTAIKEEYNPVIDEYIIKDVIKICKTHSSIDSEQQ